MIPASAPTNANPLGFDHQAEATALGVTLSLAPVRSSGAQLSEISRLLADDGTVRVEIGSSCKLADAAQARERARRGGIQGKIVPIVAAH